MLIFVLKGSDYPLGLCRFGIPAPPPRVTFMPGWTLTGQPSSVASGHGYHWPCRLGSPGSISGSPGGWAWWVILRGTRQAGLQGPSPWLQLQLLVGHWGAHQSLIDKISPQKAKWMNSSDTWTLARLRFRASETDRRQVDSSAPMGSLSPPRESLPG